ncbi:MAG: T9SS type A sorting domain-containing protein [Ginsengibacter sp.]
MVKLFVPVFCSLVLASFHTAAAVRLTAIPDTRTSSVSLQWNMVNYAAVTAYVLLKSIDGVVWQVAAANPVYRNYTSSSILVYRDQVNNEEKLFYKVRVYDAHDNTVALSNTAVAEIHKAIYHGAGNSQPHAPSNPNVASRSSKAWQLYPNPVTDVLNLSYSRSDKPRGVINVTITDATGKVVIRFRQASNNMQLRITVSNLHTGLYFIKINVLDEVQMNDKFVKQ